MNANKCHLLITNHDDKVSAFIGDQTIYNSKSEKLLGVCIDNKLDFTKHVSNICKKLARSCMYFAEALNIWIQKS